MVRYDRVSQYPVMLRVQGTYGLVIFQLNYLKVKVNRTKNSRFRTTKSALTFVGTFFIRMIRFLLESIRNDL